MDGRGYAYFPRPLNNMKAQRDIIENLLSEKPQYQNRKLRYNAIAEILQNHFNIILEPKDIQLICSLADEYRHQTEADEVGEELEKDWHKTPEQHNFENGQNQLFKSIIKNI